MSDLKAGKNDFLSLSAGNQKTIFFSGLNKLLIYSYNSIFAPSKKQR